MAIVKVMHGDLLRLFKTGAFQTIAHGCNTCNVMGAGIAGQISAQFPEAFEADTSFHAVMQGANHDGCKRMGGELSIGHTKHGPIFNLYTQILPGRNADYQLLQKSLENLNKFCKQRSIQRVGLPLIGAGIGGLDILAAMTIINACTPDIDVTIVVYSSTSTDKVWKVASSFWNMSFPRRFEGVAYRDGNNVWRIRTFEMQDFRVWDLSDAAKLMLHNGESALSLSNSTPWKLLVIKDQSEYDSVKDRLYTVKESK